MNTEAIATIRSIAIQAINAHPNMKSDIIDLTQMAIEEINEGESADNEIELLKGSIEDLIK